MVHLPIAVAARTVASKLRSWNLFLLGVNVFPEVKGRSNFSGTGALTRRIKSRRDVCSRNLTEVPTFAKHANVKFPGLPSVTWSVINYVFLCLLLLLPNFFVSSSWIICSELAREYSWWQLRLVKHIKARTRPVSHCIISYFSLLNSGPPALFTSSFTLSFFECAASRPQRQVWPEACIRNEGNNLVAESANLPAKFEPLTSDYALALRTVAKKLSERKKVFISAPGSSRCVFLKKRLKGQCVLRNCRLKFSQMTFEKRPFHGILVDRALEGGRKFLGANRRPGPSDSPSTPSSTWSSNNQH